jgi:hypothetical protein
MGLTKLGLIEDQVLDGARLVAAAPHFSNAETGTLSQSDPTDHALAAIASILDQPGEGPREAEKPAAEAKPVMPPPIPSPPPLNAPPPPLAPAMASTDGDDYSKLGPGPIAAIRFKWTARRADNGEYFVDETIGESSAPITSGPMTRDAAINMVDEREAEARHRFEQLRHEMTGRAAAADLVRKGAGEA